MAIILVTIVNKDNKVKPNNRTGSSQQIIPLSLDTTTLGVNVKRTTPVLLDTMVLALGSNNPLSNRETIIVCHKCLITEVHQIEAIIFSRIWLNNKIPPFNRQWT